MEHFTAKETCNADCDLIACRQRQLVAVMEAGWLSPVNALAVSRACMMLQHLVPSILFVPSTPRKPSWPGHDRHGVLRRYHQIDRLFAFQSSTWLVCTFVHLGLCADLGWGEGCFAGQLW